MAVHGQDGGAGSGASDAPPVYTGRGPVTNGIDRVAGAVENVAMTIASGTPPVSRKT